MKAVWSALAFVLWVTGCEEGFQQENYDPTVPVAIACEGCSELVSKSTESCDRCGHATLASILAYKKEVVRKAKEARILKRESELALARSKIEEIERRWDEVDSAYEAMERSGQYSSSKVAIVSAGPDRIIKLSSYYVGVEEFLDQLKERGIPIGRLAPTE